MPYYIGSYNCIVGKGRKTKEYYISKGTSIIAGDFGSYKAAKTYLVSVILKSKKR